MSAHRYLSVDSRVEGRCPDTGTVAVGIVTALHRTGDPLGDVTIVDEAGGYEHRIEFVRLAPRFTVGDRVFLDSELGTVGTVAAASSSTVEVVFDDGSGYHGTDTAVQHAA